MCPASRAKRIPRRQGPASKGNLFSWWFCSVSFRSDPPPCRLRGRRPAKRPRLAPTASQPPRAGRVGQTSDRLTDHRPQFPLAGSPCQQTTGSTLFCSVVQCPVSTACALCFCPSDDVDFCRRHIDIDCPAVLVAVAKGRSTPDRPAIPQPSPPSTPAHHLSVRRLPFPSRWGPSVFDFASPSPVQSASRRPLGCAPTAPSHRCSLHIAAAPTPNLHQQLARLHQAPPAHRAILPPPSRLSSTTRPPIGPPSSIREPRENNPAAVDSAVARRTSPLLHEACLLRRPDHHSSSPRCICSLHLRPASPAHGVLSCAVLTCRGFSLATARLRTETGDPFLSSLVAASTDLILGRLHFYRTPSGHCFFFVRPPPVSLDSLSCNRCQPHGAAFPLAACLVFGPPMRRAAAHIFLACRFSRT